jgi:hypothetical protein
VNDDGGDGRLDASSFGRINGTGIVLSASIRAFVRAALGRLVAQQHSP